MAATILFCTDAFWDEHGESVVAIDPSVEVIRLVGDLRVTASELDRMTVAYFSDDVWPARAKSFAGACLRAPNLRWFQSSFAGTDDPVYARLRANRVTVTNSVGAAAPSMAQTVMLYLLAMSRDLPGAIRNQAARRWLARPCVDLDGMRLGIVGFGAIGSETARLAQAFGMDVTGVRRNPTGDELCRTVPTTQLHEVLAWSDAVVVTAPLTEETRRLIDWSAFAAMRRGVWFVNVGRGDVVDEGALIDALESGHVAAAALDVFATEPLPADSALWRMPNVIVTPHDSGTTDRTRRRAVEQFLDNFARYTRRDPLTNVMTDELQTR